MTLEERVKMYAKAILVRPCVYDERSDCWQCKYCSGVSYLSPDKLDHSPGCIVLKAKEDMG